jgi:hypothetical protein
MKKMLIGAVALVALATPALAESDSVLQELRGRWCHEANKGNCAPSPDKISSGCSESDLNGVSCVLRAT